MKTKICSICKIEKLLSEFHKRKVGKFGVEARCKICKRDSEKIRYQKNKEHINKQSRVYYNSHKEDRKTRYKNNKPHFQDLYFKRLYGITLEQYKDMLEAQNSVCAICGKEETAKNQHGIKKLAVDHDHQSGKVRGLLCAKCNHILGMSFDSVTILQQATDYLKKYQEL